MAESREGYVPPEPTGFESKNEPTQEQVTEQNIEAENEPTDMDQAAEEAAEDIADELNLEKEFAAPPSAETRRTVTKKISDAIKHYWRHTSAGAVVGFAGASAARIAIKQGVLLSLGGSMGAGAIAGGVAGAAIEGARVYIKERKKFVAEDIIEQMNNAQNPQEKAAIVAKAESALKEARISDPGKTSDLVEAVRAARLHLETELEKDELKGKSQAQQISWLLKSAGRNLKEVPRSDKKNAKALLKKVAFASEKLKVDYKKVAEAVAKGALAGALGGAIGGALAHYVFDNLHPGQWMEKAVEPIMESNPGISQEQAQAMAEEALRQKAEAAAAAAARVLEEGRQQLLQENFTGEAERGDGWTHLARKAVHDYLVNLRELSPESAPDLNMEQLVHIEDTIVKEQLRSGASELIHPGQRLELRGEHIQSLIAKAQGLSPEKIQNIGKVLEMPEHYISPATIAEMTDYAEVAHTDNDFARAVAEHSQEAAKLAAVAVSEIAAPEAVSRAVPKATGTLTEKISAPTAETAKETATYTKAILAVLAAGSLAGAGYAAKRVFGKKLAEAKEPKAEEPVIQKPVPKTPVATAPAEVQPVPAPEEKTEEDKISPPQESQTPAAVAAGALAGAITAGAIASAEKKDEPTEAPQPSPVSQEHMEHTGEREPNEELISKLGELNQKYEPYGIIIDADPNLGGMARLAALDELEAVLDGLDLDEFKEYFPNGILLTSQNQRGLGDAISFDFRQTGDELSAFVHEAMNEARAQTVAKPKKAPSAPVIPTAVEPSAPAVPKPTAPSAPAAPKPPVPAAPTTPKIPAKPAAAPLATPEATPTAETAPKPEKRDWWKVKRETEVMAVEDLFGDMRLFEKHVATLGVAEKDSRGRWKWTGGNKKVVFLGDILGDRDMDGTEIVTIINDLAAQAEKQGGQVDILCGNHDMFFIRFLSHLETNEWGKRMAMDTGQAVGIWELAQFDPGPDSELKKINPKLNPEEFEQRKEELADKLYQRIPAILENMRTDSKGRKILEAICRIKIAAIHDDTLFCHTDPTQRMAVDLGRNDNIPARVAEVNRIFQENLRRVLFQSGKFDNDFQEIEEIYTDTNNREYFTILPFYQLGSNLLLEIVKNLHKKGEIQFTDTDYNFGSSDWGWKKEIINYLDYLSSSTEHIEINILTVEECIARWRQENDLIGDYTTEIVELFKMCADASKNKSDKWNESTESLLDKFIEKISNLNTPEKYVQKVRNSGINTILHGHTPISENPNEKNPDYYNQEGLVIASVHGSERGVSIIDKKGKINLTVTTVREHQPSVR